MSDDPREAQRKFRDAALLASQFFKDLATIFEEGGQGLAPAATYKKSSGDKQIPILLMAPSNSDSQYVKQQSNGANHKSDLVVKNRNGALDIADKAHAQAQNDHTKTGQPIAEEKSKKTKKQKKILVPGMPNIKKPLSAYMLYNNHRRPVLKSEYPKESLPDLSCRIGEEWKKLSNDQKLEWTEKAKHLRLEYEIEVFQAQQKQNIQQNGSVSVQEQSQPKVSSPQKKSKTVGDKRSHQDVKNQKNDSSSITSLSDDDIEQDQHVAVQRLEQDNQEASKLTSEISNFEKCFQ